MNLSELIKACGGSFRALEHVRRDGRSVNSLIGDEKDEELIWKASCWEESEYGETPEEAVEKLLNTLQGPPRSRSISSSGSPSPSVSPSPESDEDDGGFNPLGGLGGFFGGMGGFGGFGGGSSGGGGASGKW